MIRPTFVAATLMLGACACPQQAGSPDHPPPPIQQTPPMRAQVPDTAEFEQYIAARPTPAQFHERYPGVTLVLPGEFSTKEFRRDRSRYFAELDDQGRIKGGRFM